MRAAVPICLAASLAAGCGQGDAPIVSDGGCIAAHSRGVVVDWSHAHAGPLPRALAAKLALRDMCGQPPDAGSTQGDAGASSDAGVDAGGIGPNLDWNVSVGATVNATPALWIANYPNPSASDAVYFGSSAAGATFVKLTNLYQATPTQAWTQTTGGIFGGAITLSLDGSKVYALDQAGNLYCFDASNGGQCAGWSAQFYQGGNPAGRRSPWVDYTTGAIFFDDAGGLIQKINGGTGAAIWTLNLGAGALLSSPVVLGGFIYIGDLNGRFYRIHDPGATAPAGSDISGYDLCGAAPCDPTMWQIVNAATADVANSALYVAAGGIIFEFPLGAGTWVPTAQQSLNTPANDVLFSSPILDLATNSLYVGYFNAIFRVPLPLGSRPLGTLLYGATGRNGFPFSSPLVYAGHVYVGDELGYMEQYSCLTGNGGPDLIAIAGPYGDRQDTAPLVDYANGNIVFGYGSRSGTTGGVVQITQMGNWGCGTQSACSTAGCGGAGACTPQTACVPDGVVPSAVWRSNGGGAGMATGQLETSIGSGVLAPGSVSAGGNTLTFGFIGDETF